MSTAHISDCRMQNGRFPSLLVLRDIQGKTSRCGAANSYRPKVACRRETDRGFPNESNRGDGPGCGNGRDDAGGAARAAGGGARQLSGANYGDVVVQVHASGFTG